MSPYRKYYEILGLNEGASLEEIKKAYHNLVIKYHPDHGGNIEKMAEINLAYNFLKKHVDFSQIKNSNTDKYDNNSDDINNVEDALHVFGLYIGENYDWHLIEEIYKYQIRSHHDPAHLKKIDEAYEILKEEYNKNDIFCNNCGYKVRFEDNFCNNCGYKLK